MQTLLKTEGGFTDYAGSGTGAMILANGAHRAYISAHGNPQNRVPIRHTASGANPIGTANVLKVDGNDAWCTYGRRDPTNAARGYMGRWRFELSAANALTQIYVTKEIIGVGSTGLVFGIDKGGNSAQLYVSDDQGASWANWVLLPDAPRPIDNEPQGCAIDKTHAARGLFVGSAGKAYLVTGQSSPTRTVCSILPSKRAGAGPRTSCTPAPSTRRHRAWPM